MRRRGEVVDVEPTAEEEALDWAAVLGVPPCGGAWSRPDHGDELVCKQHDLAVSEH